MVAGDDGRQAATAQSVASDAGDGFRPGSMSAAGDATDCSGNDDAGSIREVAAVEKVDDSGAAGIPALSCTLAAGKQESARKAEAGAGMAPHIQAVEEAEAGAGTPALAHIQAVGTAAGTPTPAYIQEEAVGAADTEARTPSPACTLAAWTEKHRDEEVDRICGLYRHHSPAYMRDGTRYPASIPGTRRTGVSIFFLT